MRRIICVWLLWIVLPIVPAAPILASQQRHFFVAVGETENPHHQSFISALRKVIEASPNAPEVVFKDVDEFDDNIVGRDQVPQLVLTVGTRAATKVAALERRRWPPVLHALISQSAFRTLYPTTGPQKQGQIGALFIDQPLERIVDLIRTALPRRMTVSAILGPFSRDQEDALRRLCRAKGLELRSITIAQTSDLTAAMSQSLTEDSVLLTLPDAVVVNRDSAKTLVLGAYARGIPYVGYSQALVKAGALIAVHTTPEDAGTETAEMLLTALTETTPKLPPPRYPTYFTVSANYQVARALGIHLPSEGALRQGLVEEARTGHD